MWHTSGNRPLKKQFHAELCLRAPDDRNHSLLRTLICSHRRRTNRCGNTADHTSHSRGPAARKARQSSPCLTPFGVTPGITKGPTARCRCGGLRVPADSFVEIQHLLARVVGPQRESCLRRLLYAGHSQPPAPARIAAWSRAKHCCLSCMPSLGASKQHLRLRVATAAAATAG